MDYKRKKRWVKYNHIKCKMYLRNDFHFECAYCRMREQDAGIWGEECFEKDHFVASASGTDSNLDSYDNMIYACSKCNGTKSDMNTELLLNPCKDDIYSGTHPHVKNLGKSGHYQLSGNTAEGRQYIKSLQLNSKFYREMRERQEQARRDDYELECLINEISVDSDVSEDLLQRLRVLVCNNYLIPTGRRQDVVFRCGHSKAGLAFREVLDILDNLSVPYELLFAENDIDIKVQYNDKDYLCEIILNDSAEMPVRNIRMKKVQREKWMAEAAEYGVMYYYMKSGRLEFYSIGVENRLLACLKSG